MPSAPIHIEMMLFPQPPLAYDAAAAAAAAPNYPTNMPRPQAATAASAPATTPAEAETAATTKNSNFAESYICASLFPSTTVDASTAESYSNFLKRKRSDMQHYNSAANNALAFFATASRTALREDTADYDTLKQIASAKFARQRAAIGLDTKKATEAYAAAALDTAKRSHTIATAAMTVSCEALQDAKRLATVASAVAIASPHVRFTLCIDNLNELETSHNSCKAAVVAAYKTVANALLDLHQATKAANAAEAKEAKIQKDEANVAAMLQRHQKVAKEYTDDAREIQHQMETIITERQIASDCDLALLTSLIADAAAHGDKRQCV